VLLVERAPVVGGMASSFEVAGIRVDHGSHRLHSSADPGVLALVRRLLGSDLQTRPRNGRIALDGRWLAFPLRAADLAANLSPRVAAGLAGGVVTGRLRRQQADTFAGVVTARLGSTMGERFYFPYARKLWGLEPDEISGEQARRRISANGPGTVLQRVFRPRAAGARTFLYPRLGFGQMVERLAEDAVDAGARIDTGVTATALSPSAGSVDLDDGRSISFGQLWSTIPVTHLARLAAAPAPVLAAAGSLEFRAMVLVYVVIPQRQWTTFDAHYLPGPETPLTRISEPRNYRDGPDPDDHTVLCAEIPCALGDGTWCATSDDLAALVSHDLGALGLPPVSVNAVEVRRLPAAYPIYRTGFEAAMNEVTTWVANQPWLRSFGRLGLFAHDNTQHALLEATIAVATIDDRDRWDRAVETFASHVVED
jgi:protoporphyrinogen oxidase